MKRFLAIALLTTALSTPAFATGLGVSTGTNANVGVNTGAADIGVSADTGTSAGASTEQNTNDDSMASESAPRSDDNTAGSTAATGMGSSTSSNPANVGGNASSGGSATASAGGSINAESLGHNDVVLIQQALRQEGLYNGTADGIWGPRTASALMQFQQQNRLGATGSLNQNTLNELGVELGASSAGASSNNQSTIDSSSGVGSTATPGTANTY